MNRATECQAFGFEKPREFVNVDKPVFERAHEVQVDLGDGDVISGIAIAAAHGKLTSSFSVSFRDVGFHQEDTLFLCHPQLSVISLPCYAEAFLRLVASIYPGYHYPSGFGGVIVGMLYGLLDGAVAGALIAWLYNLFLPKQATGA